MSPIIHGMEDYHCFVDRSVVFHVAPGHHSKESCLAASGRYGHNVRVKPRHRMKRYKLILEFLREKLGGGVESGGSNSS